MKLTGVRVWKMFDVHLLAAGFSAILGVEVVPPDRGAHLPKLSIHSLFQLTYIPVPLESVDSGQVFDVHAKTLTGHKVTIPVTSDFTIAHVKAAIQEKEEVPALEQRLVFSSKVLADEETVGGAGIFPGATLYLVIKAREGEGGGGGGGPEFQLDLGELAAKFDYDFTERQDDGKKYMRGRFEYRRPYGWYRYALNVVGKYENDKWLGPGGIRTESSSDEWPVSYHGTNMEESEASSISCSSPDKASRFHHGKGVFSSPDLAVASSYAQRFKHNGHHHRIILQNRVNPTDGHLVVVNEGKYWLCPQQDSTSKVYDIRPYGVLVSMPE